MPLKIFLSHATADRDWVQRIASDAGAGSDLFRFYMYENDTQPGRSVTAKLQSEVAKCDILMVLITRQSHKSNYMHQEVGFALGMGKLVVPIVEQGVPKKSLAMLDGIEYIRFERLKPEKCIADLSMFLFKYILEAEGGAVTVPQAATTIAPLQAIPTDSLSIAPVKFLGMSKDEVIALLLGLALLALGIYLIYSMGKGGAGSPSA